MYTGFMRKLTRSITRQQVLHTVAYTVWKMKFSSFCFREDRFGITDLEAVTLVELFQ